MSHERRKKGKISVERYKKFHKIKKKIAHFYIGKKINLFSITNFLFHFLLALFIQVVLIYSLLI
jgi:hypothetical protein